MTIDNKIIDHLADLSKLQFNATEKDAIKADLNKMLEMVEKLKEVDVDDIEPLIYMSEERNVLRADEPADMVDQETALKNAPLRDSDYFKVPKVLSK